jgi:hypothetical protein
VDVQPPQEVVVNLQAVADRVRVALDNLAAAGGPLQIADKLAAEAITGVMDCPSSCIIAEYIARVVPETVGMHVVVVPAPATARTDATGYVALSVPGTGRADATIDLPPVLSVFGRWFDAEAFPDLVANG